MVFAQTKADTPTHSKPSITPNNTSWHHVPVRQSACKPYSSSTHMLYPPQKVARCHTLFTMSPSEASFQRPGRAAGAYPAEVPVQVPVPQSRRPFAVLIAHHPVPPTCSIRCPECHGSTLPGHIQSAQCPASASQPLTPPYCTRRMLLQSSHIQLAHDIAWPSFMDPCRWSLSSNPYPCSMGTWTCCCPRAAPEQLPPSLQLPCTP